MYPIEPMASVGGMCHLFIRLRHLVEQYMAYGIAARNSVLQSLQFLA